MATAIDDPPIDEQRLSDTFAALASETRRKMLQRLAAGEASVNELAEPFDMTLPAVSKHLKVLEKAGLITRGRRAQYRPCALNPTPLIEATSWAERQREIWEASFDRMDSYLQQLQADTPPSELRPGSDPPSNQNRITE
jgi:DNA-binding transcriptional ArsR family regulator